MTRKQPVRTGYRLFVSLILLTILLSGTSTISALAPAPHGNSIMANDLRISQVYGGGGNTGAPYTHDFVELFNAGSSTINLSTYSLQYTAATGTSWGSQKTNLTGSIGPGHYYLVKLASGGAVGDPLPIADVTGTFNMSATAGKIALVSNQTSLPGEVCPNPTTNGILDLVGYGSTANCYEGSIYAPAPSNTTASLRKGNGCTDTDQNANDFATGVPNPRNSSSPTNYCSGDVAPSVTSTTPAQGATNIAVDANISVTFSEPVTVAGSWYAISCSSSGTHTAVVSGGPTTFTLNPDADFIHNETCTVTIDKDEVSDQDGTPNTMTANYGWSFTTAATSAVTKIHAIQGSGNTAAAGTFTVEAIVVGDFQGVTGMNDDKLDGLFIQEEDADADTDPATSEGIFVYCGSCPTNVIVGDKVRVTGASSEYYNMSQLNATTAGAVTVLSSGNSLPTPAAVTLPVPGVTATDLTGAQTQINAYFEPFEGMLVHIAEQLSVTEYFELSRYGQLILAQGGRFRQFTDTTLPSSTGYTAHLIDMAQRTIILDDDSNQQNHAITQDPDIPIFHPTPGGFSITNYVRGGDTITHLMGVLHWSYAGLAGTDAWRIRPVTEAFSYAFTAANPRLTTPADVGGTVKVASFNVLNYFTTLGLRGANSTAELDRQAAKIVAALMGLNADVIGVMEIQNNNGVAIADLVGRLNAVAGAGTYAAIATGTVGTDEITVGLIYKPAKVTPVGSVQILSAAAFTDPNATGTQKNRPAVAQMFEETIWGERFTVVVNHLKSKGSCPTSGPDMDQNDGQGCWNDTRQKAAAYLVGTWLPTLSASTGDPDFLIIGDLNAYRKENPITNIKNAGYTDLLDAKQGAPAYGYVFDGQLGYLDHALGSATLTLRVSGTAGWHINSDEVNLLDYNDTVQDSGEAPYDVKPAATTLYEANAYRSSDHDPVLVGLNMLPNQSNFEAHGMAWHTGSGTLRLGSSWQPGPDTDDNDGITFGVFEADKDTQVTVNVQGNPASGGRWLRLWFDWDGNGAFDDGERVWNQAVNDGNNVLTVAVPDTISTAVPYRARLYDATSMSGMGILAADPGAVGGASGGEVEDGMSPVPTAVVLASFAAMPRGEDILVSWETAMELQNLGFNLYRGASFTGPWVKLNAALIPAQNPGAVFGASYEWLDTGLTPDTTYYYRLEDVDIHGASTFHGPVSATTAGVTAVSVVAFGARGPLEGVMLAFAAAALVVWRRRR